MEPTNAEIIFYIVGLIIVVIFLLIGAKQSDNHVDITWGQRRDWERNEKRWNK